MDKKYVFGLDIGTRSIVGTVGYREEEKFIVVAQVSKEHETRAVIDGQIHDIVKVASIIKDIKEQLEEKIEMPLTEVCIAAAGRVLKTKRVIAENEFAAEIKVTEEHVRSINLLGVEKAYELIREDAKKERQQFYCVGYSIIGYFLNGYAMSMIEMHKAKRIGVELIATFLPEEVVDGLYDAVEAAGLTVAGLTLEPIAAINVVIPEKFRLLNIALVDVGAGTSDISIVQDGSIIAFGMMPLAGDEMTEAIARRYLIDFQTAEKVKKQAATKKQFSFKNIMGEKVNVSSDEIFAATDKVVQEIAVKIANRIKELNGGKSVSAVFVVGGGGKLNGFVEHMAKELELPESRVALKGSEVLKDIRFMQKGIKKDSTLVTPIGICLNYYEQQNHFIYVQVNGETVKLYDNNRLTILDAASQSGMTKEDLFPQRGKSLSFTVDGKEVVYKGHFGEPASVRLNEKEAGFNDKIRDKDMIYITPATKGEDVVLTIGEVKECKKEIVCKVDGRQVICPFSARLGDREVSSLYVIQENDNLATTDCFTIKQLKEYMGFSADVKLRAGEKVMNDFNSVLANMELTTVDDVKEAADKKEEVVPIEAQKKAVEEESFKIFVNDTEVLLASDKPHIFVDVLDVYPFDITQAGGRRLITRCNGAPADFTVPIHSGDRIELVWED